MSYKDLEAQIREWANIKAHAIKKIVDKKQAKQDRKLQRDKKAARPPMFIPDPPVRHEVEVVLNVRKVEDGIDGELFEVAFTIPTISTAEAEIKAREQAKQSGFIWRGTVSTELKK